MQPADWDFPAQMAQHSLIVTIGITYATLAPLVLIFVTLYFALWCFAYLYLIQNVYENGIQTGGTEMYFSSTHLFVGIYISQITLAGLFSAQNVFIHFIFILIQIGATLVAHYYAQKYKKIIVELPVKISLENAKKEANERLNKSDETIVDAGTDLKSQNVLFSMVGGMFKDVTGLATDVGKLGKGVTSQVVDVAGGLASATGANKILKSMVSESTISGLSVITEEDEKSFEQVDSLISEKIEDDGYEFLVYPAARKLALKKIWLPMRDPLNFTEDVIAPEYFRGGALLEAVDATVDSKGKLELGNGIQFGLENGIGCDNLLTSVTDFEITTRAQNDNVDSVNLSDLALRVAKIEEQISRLVEKLSDDSFRTRNNPVEIPFPTNGSSVPPLPPPPPPPLPIPLFSAITNPVSFTVKKSNKNVLNQQEQKPVGPTMEDVLKELKKVERKVNSISVL
ncbi:hypothetical protein HK096_006816, partial [Nowakowskiella sp. JEL0078]